MRALPLRPPLPGALRPRFRASRTRAILAMALLLTPLALGMAPGAPAQDASAQPLGPGSVDGVLRSSGPVTVTALAVQETQAGFVGVHATVEATVLAGGQGRIYVATRPLAQTDMQGSARLAAQVAAATLGVDWRSQDYLVSFTSDSTVIGGPSAGAVMTLALATALHNLVEPDSPWTLDATVAGTGTINPDGTIGPVGGIPAKAEAAKAAGVTTFLYPAGLDRATTEVAGPFGPQQVVVDMAAHCRSLGIACRPVARLEELLAAAAHVDLQAPDIPVPGTADYVRLLSPSVTAEVDSLDARVASLTADPRKGGLRGADRLQVDQELAAAREELKAAREALAAQQFYLAATESFQGAIRVGTAENLTAFYAQGRSEAVVLAALDTCAVADDAAQAAANHTADTYNALYALGAAQKRAADAASLRAQAESAHARAFTFDDWVSSLASSVYCAERARTVAWWAELRDAFPGGLAVADAKATARQAVEDAGDLVAYAQAVMAGTFNAQLQQAQSRLQAAAEALAAGRHPSAVVQAVEAASLAGVAMQAASGTGSVPDEVLQAAEQGAARAVGQARARGIEPMLSVSLVELARSQGDTMLRLESYWTARSLALLDVVAAAPADGTAGPGGAGGPGGVGGAGGAGGGAMPGGPVPWRPLEGSGYGGGTLVAFLVVGGVLGLAASGLVVVGLMARRR